MDMEVIPQSGEPIRLSELGLQVDDFIASAISKEIKKKTMDGIDGELFQGAQYRTRSIKVPSHINATDLLDVPLKRDRLFAILNGTEPFYIRELRRPKRQQYAFTEIGDEPTEDPQTSDVHVGGKRYLVLLSNEPEPVQTDRDEGLYIELDLEFETVELPYAESIGTSKDIHDDGGISLRPELWSVGMGLSSDSEKQKYFFSTSGSHTVFNPGDVPINTFRHDFRITITVQEATSVLTLFDSFGREFRIEKDLLVGDEIVIYKGMVEINGLNGNKFVERKGFPYLRKGDNIMRIEGGSVDILYDFRFYYH